MRISNSFFGPRIGIIFLFLVMLTLALLLANPLSATATLVTYAAFAFPGVLLMWRVGLAPWRVVAFGVPVGLGTTSITVVVVVAVFGWNLPVIGVVWVSLLCLTCFLPGMTFLGKKGKAGKVEQDGFSVSISILLLITLFSLFVFLPLSKMGELTGRGYAFSGLFSHDFILRALDAVALSNGIPADNYFYNGETTKNYYVLWYILPATVYNLLNHVGDIRKIVAVVCLLNVPFFLLCFYLTLRDFLGAKLSDTRAPLIFFLTLFCASYHWMFVTAKNVARAVNFHGFDSLFAKMHDVSQTWYRDLIFEPHSILALMLFFCLIAVIKSSPAVKRGWMGGILLSMIALTDTIIFFIAFFWYVSCMICDVVQSKVKILNGIYDTLAVIGVGLCIVVIMFATGVFGFTTHSNVIVIKPYIFVIVIFPLFIFLHLGLASILWISAFKDKVLGMKWQMFFLVLLSVIFMLFVTESLEGNVVLRKALKIARVPLALFSGYYLCHYVGSKLYRVVMVLLLLALPTLITDMWALANVNDADHATYISKADMEAMLWIKNNTSREAVVQGVIDYPGYYDFSLTACFGERKAALGHWKMAYQRYPNLPALAKRAELIKKLFGRYPVDNHCEVSQLLNIDYVVVGPAERLQYNVVPDFFLKNNNCFIQVFNNNNTSIYQRKKY